MNARHTFHKDELDNELPVKLYRTKSQSRNPTTSFLTATTLIYAIGAGITAAAGTRLALQLLIVKYFILYSFQLQDLKKPRIVISCHYLPVSGLDNLRACCLPWMW